MYKYRPDFLKKLKSEQMACTQCNYRKDNIIYLNQHGFSLVYSSFDPAEEWMPSYDAINRILNEQNLDDEELMTAIKTFRGLKPSRK